MTEPAPTDPEPIGSILRRLADSGELSPEASEAIREGLERNDAPPLGWEGIGFPV